ncbi:MAG: hypothetical protein MUF54_22040 [Polyangiaceae bacterium]|nr:hypothetical protein [Polyangiaceae bacterium]
MLLLATISVANGCTDHADSPDESRRTRSLATTRSGDFNELVRDDGSGMVHAAAVPAVVSQNEPPDAHDKRLAESQTVKVTARNPNEEVLAILDGQDPGEWVNMTVTLDEPPGDWDYFASLQDNDSARATFIEERKATLARLQEPLVSWLTSRCGAPAIRLWLVNQVQTKVPAGLAREILARPGVRGLSLSAKTVPGTAWDGSHSQDGTRLTQFYNAQLDGRAGNRVSSTGNIRVGIMEAAMLNRDHLGWRDSLNGPTRIVSVKDCGGASCVSQGTSGIGDPLDPHGTRVTWVAAGSIQQGQDNFFPGSNTLDQRRRSGHLAESDIYFYTGDTTGMSVGSTRP